MTAILNTPRQRDSKGRFVGSKANMNGAIQVCEECGGTDFGTGGRIHHRWACSYHDEARREIQELEDRKRERNAIILAEHGIDPSSAVNPGQLEVLMQSKPDGTVTQEWVTSRERRSDSGVVNRYYYIHPTKPSANQNPVKKWVLWNEHNPWNSELFHINPQSSPAQQPEKTSETTTSPELEEANSIVEEVDRELGTGSSAKSGIPSWLKAVLVVAGLFILKKMFEK